MIEIRDEQPGDRDAVHEVNRQAFGRDDEARLVDALRDAGAATLSLVATLDTTIVGHILFTPVHVGGLPGAGLAPMAVVPAHQRAGIGSQLVERGLSRLVDRGCPFVVVLGHPAFYPRFGFVPAASQGLTCDWDVPTDVFLVNVLNPMAAASLKGHVRYRPEFSAFE